MFKTLQVEFMFTRGDVTCVTVSCGVQAEEDRRGKCSNSITLLKTQNRYRYMKTSRNTHRTQGNIQHNDWQRLNQTEGTKYKEESNIMMWKQVIQMMRMMHRCLMREWVQVWRQEDPGKCSEEDADRKVQTETVTTCWSK